MTYQDLDLLQDETALAGLDAWYEEELAARRESIRNIRKALRQEKWQVRKLICLELLDYLSVKFKGVVTKQELQVRYASLNTKRHSKKTDYLGHCKAECKYYAIEYADGYECVSYNGTIWYKLRNGRYLEIGYVWDC